MDLALKSTLIEHQTVPRQGGPMTVDQAVEHDRFVARGQKLAHAMTSNITGSAANEDFHGGDLYCFSNFDG